MYCINKKYVKFISKLSQSASTCKTQKKITLKINYLHYVKQVQQKKMIQNYSEIFIQCIPRDRLKKSPLIM